MALAYGIKMNQRKGIAFSQKHLFLLYPHINLGSIHHLLYNHQQWMNCHMALACGLIISDV
jgi:hypothetical protein